ncbi:MAG: hypothetical protein ACTSRG_01660 [Candidatus Helarchaeota archaeon]
MDYEVDYFYFDYSLVLKCTCGRIIKQSGTNHTNEINCKCGKIFYVKPKVEYFENNQADKFPK